jgi:spore germination cell wall hydrolase CwlJ-like protein
MPARFLRQLLCVAVIFTSPSVNVHALDNQDELRCLALAIYHEARGETARGQTSVGYVIINRVTSDRWPNTICQVVWQKRYVKRIGRYVGQFSWTNDGRSDVPRDEQAWIRAQNIALAVLQKRAINVIRGSTHYHHTSIKPWWRRHFALYKTVGKHVFYE